MPHDHAPSVPFKGSPLQATANPVLVEVTRGNAVESRHRGAAVIVDVEGHVRAAWGDVEAPVFPRSAVKPFQALALVETGAADAFGVSEKELALACASHSGLPMHTEAVAAWLDRLGLAESDLACGPHPPMDPAFHVETPCRLHNNCSGKHTGFLTLARHLGAPLVGYEKRHHALQQRMLGALEQMTGADLTDAPVGTDGCCIPTWAIPLGNLALAWARFGVPDGLPDARAAACRRLWAAMAAYPDMIAGPGRLCSQVIRASQGRIVAKVGAEGVYCAALPEYGLGLALKIDDGAKRGAEVAVAQLLHLIGATEGLEAEIPAHQDILDTFGRPVGTVRPAQLLERLP